MTLHPGHSARTDRAARGRPSDGVNIIAALLDLHTRDGHPSLTEARTRTRARAGRPTGRANPRKGASTAHQLWARTFTALGGSRHCPMCKQLATELRHARKDTTAAAALDARFVTHAVNAHPHLRPLYEARPPGT